MRIDFLTRVRWDQVITTFFIFSLGLGVGGILVLAQTSLFSLQESFELYRQIGMKHMVFRCLTTNNVSRAQEALICQMADDIAIMAYNLESRKVMLPMVKRKLVSELQSMRNRLDYYHFDFGAIQSTNISVKLNAKQAQAVLSKYTVGKSPKRTQGGTAIGNQSIPADTNHPSSIGITTH